MNEATEITVEITTPEGARELPLGAEPLTVGRTAGVSVVVPTDSGLSRRHLKLRREGVSVHAEDEHSTNGSFFNGQRIGSGGVMLSDGDEVKIGNATSVRVRVKHAAHASAAHAGGAAAGAAVAAGAGAAGPSQSPHSPHAQFQPAQSSSALVYLIPGIAVALILLCTVALALYKVKHSSSAAGADSAETTDADSNGAARNRDGGAKGDGPARASLPADAPAVGSPSAAAGSAQSPAASLPATAAAPVAPLPVFNTQPPETPPASVKLYQKMTDEEKTEFIKQRAQHVAVMMGNRPYAFTPDAIQHIKFWLDAYARRAGNGRSGLWGGDTVAIVERARGYAPSIIRTFQQYNVPVVVGLYIPFIETEYTNIQSNNSAGAAGLFQFLGPTAEMYGVPASERTNVDKMSVAAAKYFRDNIMSFGTEPMSVALSIAGYNRAPESVKRDLRNVLSQQDNAEKERSFWTLIANKGILDEKFQTENVNYVPRFFAAAIFGETPWAFGVQGRPLSMCTQPEPSAPTAAPPANKPAAK